MLKSPLERLTPFKHGYATDFFPDTIEEVPNEEAAQAAKNVAPAEDKKEAPAAESAKSNAAKSDTVKSDSVKTEKPAAAAAVKSEEEIAAEAREADPLNEKTKGPFWTGKYDPKLALPPEQVPQVRVNDDAPMPFVQMLMANRAGDKVMAARYADTWVKYQQNFFFEVRELTQLIGEAMIQNKLIDDDDWDGMPQYINYEFAKTRRETNDLFKPTQEAAMRMIKPDEHNQADVYYFFRFDCAYCRTMAPDVERLYKTFKYDRNVKMVGMMLEDTPADWMKEYRKYTGLTLPTVDGKELAKSFNIKAAPALVVVAPNGKRAYLKSGQQSFASMYEFVRTVQGLPATMSPDVQQIAAMKIGEVETSKFNPGKNLSVWLTRENEKKEVEQRLSKSKSKPQRIASRTETLVATPKKKTTMEKF